MHLTALCMHVLHVLPNDVKGQCMQLLHRVCCFDFVSYIPLSPATFGHNDFFDEAVIDNFVQLL
jgi:hypothetical protein